ncbi:MAG: PocR ligand-binding domain-containing protein [Eubacteriales bacterium]|nr:PocR ligand-binding domain-containing protein [Eubacteriales bacterium]
MNKEAHKKSLRFAELVNISELGELCKSLTAITGAVTAILDLEGNILVATGWQDICTRFHRVHIATASRCQESDTILAGQLKKGEGYHVYKCKNGLVDVAVPVTIGGEHVANFFTGQFFFEPPDKEYFILQAEEFEFDKTAYLAALSRVPIFTENQVKGIMDFFCRLVRLIGEMGLAKKRLEETQAELVRKEKFSILGRLAGIVGHEIRNPLGVMSNAVYFLKTVLPDADDMVKEYLDIIKQEIDNSQRIMADLLDFAHTKTPQARPVAVRDLVAESLGKCRVPGNIEVRTDIPDALPEVNVDPFQMGQVLQNLIVNAIQAMPERGSLHLSANSGSVPGSVEITVTDTGEGISPENMEKLFQPLFTTKTKGTGLGLAVCKNLTEANGGRIEAESRLGDGATFRVMLPVREDNK